MNDVAGAGDADLVEAGVVDLREAYRRGKARPSEVVSALLRWTDRVEPKVGALIRRLDERAMAAAAGADERWREGTARPLEGIPFGAKDIISTAGIPTTGGSLVYGDLVPQRSATVVRRLEEAGALLLAKLCVPEFAFGDARPDHQVANPWNAARWTGGSSSGAAAALAACELPAAIGTDTGGSIRVPSSYCGVTGLKPTHGRVPRDGVMTVSWTLDHTGPMGRSGRDVAALLAVMAGPDPADPTSAPNPVDAYEDALTGDLGDVTIGIPDSWFLERCEPAVLSAFEEALSIWKDAGARLCSVTLPHAHLAPTMAWIITVAEFASAQQVNRDRLDLFTESAAKRFIAGEGITAVDYLRALRGRHLVQQDLDEAFSRVQAVVTPGTISVAPRLDESFEDRFGAGDLAWLEGIARNFLIFNLCGLPAAVAPAGWDEGLPVSVQVAAAPFQEGTCLRLVDVLQRAADHHRRRPQGLPTNSV